MGDTIMQPIEPGLGSDLRKNVDKKINAQKTTKRFSSHDLKEIGKLSYTFTEKISLFWKSITGKSLSETYVDRAKHLIIQHNIEIISNKFATDASEIGDIGDIGDISKKLWNIAENKKNFLGMSDSRFENDLTSKQKQDIEHLLLLEKHFGNEGSSKLKDVFKDEDKGNLSVYHQTSIRLPGKSTSSYAVLKNINEIHQQITDGNISDTIVTDLINPLVQSKPLSKFTPAEFEFIEKLLKSEYLILKIKKEPELLLALFKMVNELQDTSVIDILQDHPILGNGVEAFISMVNAANSPSMFQDVLTFLETTKNNPYMNEILKQHAGSPEGEIKLLELTKCIEIFKKYDEKKQTTDKKGEFISWIQNPANAPYDAKNFIKQSFLVKEIEQEYGKGFAENIEKEMWHDGNQDINTALEILEISRAQWKTPLSDLGLQSNLKIKLDALYVSTNPPPTEEQITSAMVEINKAITNINSALEKLSTVDEKNRFISHMTTLGNAIFTETEEELSRSFNKERGKKIVSSETKKVFQDKVEIGGEVVETYARAADHAVGFAEAQTPLQKFRGILVTSKRQDLVDQLVEELGGVGKNDQEVINILTPIKALRDNYHRYGLSNEFDNELDKFLKKPGNQKLTAKEKINDFYISQMPIRLKINALNNTREVLQNQFTESFGVLYDQFAAKNIRDELKMRSSLDNSLGKVISSYTKLNLSPTTQLSTGIKSPLITLQELDRKRKEKGIQVNFAEELLKGLQQSYIQGASLPEALDQFSRSFSSELEGIDPSRRGYIQTLKQQYGSEFSSWIEVLITEERLNSQIFQTSNPAKQHDMLCQIVAKDMNKEARAALFDKEFVGRHLKPSEMFNDSSRLRLVKLAKWTKRYSENSSSRPTKEELSSFFTLFFEPIFTQALDLPGNPPQPNVFRRLLVPPSNREKAFIKIAHDFTKFRKLNKEKGLDPLIRELFPNVLGDAFASATSEQQPILIKNTFELFELALEIKKNGHYSEEIVANGIKNFIDNFIKGDARHPSEILTGLKKRKGEIIKSIFQAYVMREGQQALKAKGIDPLGAESLFSSLAMHFTNAQHLPTADTLQYVKAVVQLTIDPLIKGEGNHDISQTIQTLMNDKDKSLQKDLKIIDQTQVFPTIAGRIQALLLAKKGEVDSKKIVKGFAENPARMLGILSRLVKEVSSHNADKKKLEELEEFEETVHEIEATFSEIPVLQRAGTTLGNHEALITPIIDLLHKDFGKALDGILLGIRDILHSEISEEPTSVTDPQKQLPTVMKGALLAKSFLPKPREMAMSFSQQIAKAQVARLEQKATAENLLSIANLLERKNLSKEMKKQLEQTQKDLKLVKTQAISKSDLDTIIETLSRVARSSNEGELEKLNEISTNLHVEELKIAENLKAIIQDILKTNIEEKNKIVLMGFVETLQKKPPKAEEMDKMVSVLSEWSKKNTINNAEINKRLEAEANNIKKTSDLMQNALLFYLRPFVAFKVPGLNWNIRFNLRGPIVTGAGFIGSAAKFLGKFGGPPIEWVITKTLTRYITLPPEMASPENEKKVKEAIGKLAKVILQGVGFVIPAIVRNHDLASYFNFLDRMDGLINSDTPLTEEQKEEFATQLLKTADQFFGELQSYTGALEKTFQALPELSQYSEPRKT